MNFCSENLKSVLLIVAAMGTVLSAEAQESTQPILFSAPDNGSASEPGDMSGSPRPDFANMPQVPPAIFTWQPPVAAFPRPAPPVNPRQNDGSMRDLLDQRKNWSLMTPAEIMGATTPGKILGLPERDAAGQPKNQTPEERFLEMQNQPRHAVTNGVASGKSRWSKIFSGSPDGQPDAGAFNPADSGNSAHILNRYLNASRNNEPSGNQSDDGNWSKLFGLPPQPLQSPARQMEMEEFRQLLEPPSAAVTTPGGGAFPLKRAAENPFSAADSPFALPKRPSLDASSSLPTLPSVSIQNNEAMQPVAPSWAPKSAPWLSPMPEPGTIPQRKF